MFRLPRASSTLAFGLSLFFTMSTAGAVDIDPTTQAAVAGDFNGDGRMDALLQPLAATQPGAILLQDGTGNLTVFAQQWDAGYLGLDWSETDTALTTADLNGDGLDDVILQPRTAGQTAAVLITDPSIQLLHVSQLLPAGYLGLDWSSAANVITAGDFDGDRQKELLLQSRHQGGPMAMVHADATGQLAAVMQQFIDGYLGRHWDAADETFYVGDFNGDGRQDLLVQSNLEGQGESVYALLLAGPDGRFASVAETWNLSDLGADWDPATHKIVISDVNHDGIMDITLQSTVGGSNYLFEGNAQGQFIQPAAQWTGTESASDALNAGAGTNTPSTAPAAASMTSLAAPQLLTANILTGPTSSEPSPTLPGGGGGGGSGLQAQLAPQNPGSGQIMAVNTVGRVEGSGGVSGGTATYSIPIIVAPGRAGIKPSLSLSYSSRGGNGEMGMGWSLGAGSQIHRCPATTAMDGYSSGVTYTANDRLCLDGQHLVLVSGAYGADGAVYRTELDSFALITESGAISSNTSSFKVQEKDGHTLHYGYASNI
ncbi:MAG TPA: FG-GAP-like repeat-containing protein, partial [Gammaproteobacteria bacterium]